MNSDEKTGDKIRILAMSDTHDLHYKICIKELPPADIFIHAGDFTCNSDIDQIRRFRQFLQELPYKHKIVIPGNHDFVFDEKKYETVLKNKKHKNNPLNPKQQIRKMKQVCTFLMHEPIEVEGIKIFGSPMTLDFFFGQWGFTYKKEQSHGLLSSFPDDIDVLITHCPPHDILDLSLLRLRSGCPDLREKVLKIQPQAHIFGHIHEAYGNLKIGNTTFYNASSKKFHDQRLNPPHLIEVIRKKDIKKGNL